MPRNGCPAAVHWRSPGGCCRGRIRRELHLDKEDVHPSPKTLRWGLRERHGSTSSPPPTVAPHGRRQPVFVGPARPTRTNPDTRAAALVGSGTPAAAWVWPLYAPGCGIRHRRNGHLDRRTSTGVVIVSEHENNTENHGRLAAKIALIRKLRVRAAGRQGLTGGQVRCVLGLPTRGSGRPTCKPASSVRGHQPGRRMSLAPRSGTPALTLRPTASERKAGLGPEEAVL